MCRRMCRGICRTLRSGLRRGQVWLASLGGLPKERFHVVHRVVVCAILACVVAWAISYQARWDRGGDGSRVRIRGSTRRK